jgi:hypothetical protein
VRISLLHVAPLSVLLLTGCSAQNREGFVRSNAAIESLETALSGSSCAREIDRNDPNETPYLVCPGVGGYTLIVRRVDAGRQSIDVVDPAKRVMPLNYHEFITRRMSNLADKVEWRVMSRDGKQVPVAVIVKVQAREDTGDPEKVTGSYVAVAKITPTGACVTDRIPEGSQSDAEVRAAADSAQERQCVSPQPPLSVDGVVVR